MIFPKSTEVGNRFIPKEKFYEKGSFNTKLKESMVNDVAKIILTNTISASTLNVESGKVFTEIQVLKILLKNKDFNKNILDAIDISFRSSFVLFLLENNNQYSFSLAYKEVTKSDTSTIVKRWFTEWDDNILDLKINGMNIDNIYENLIQQISNNELSDNKDKTLKERVADSIENKKTRNKILQLKNKTKNELQFKKQLKFKGEIKILEEKL